MRRYLSGGGARLLGERGGAAGAFAAEAALSFLRGVMQRPRLHGSHDIHRDGPNVVTDKGDLAVALQVYRTCGQLHAPWTCVQCGGSCERRVVRSRRQCPRGGQHLHTVALDEEGVVGQCTRSPLPGGVPYPDPSTLG